MAIGTVISMKSNDQKYFFGFIRPVDRSADDIAWASAGGSDGDVWFDRDTLENPKDCIKILARVSYELSAHQTGKNPRAINVREIQ